MNYKRILLGGLVAGVIINASEFLLNGVVLMDDMQVVMREHNLTFASWAMVAYVIMALFYGFALAWLYAAIRPRFGPGVGTAVIAAAALWIGAYFFPSLSYIGMGLGAAGMYVLALVWGAAELVIAAIAAAYLYREVEAPLAQSVPAV